MTAAASQVPWTQRVRAAVTRNLPYKVVATVLAVLLWGVVQGQQEVEASAAVRVVYRWPEGLAVTQRAPARIHVTVAGRRTAIRRLRRADLELEVDLSDAGPGVQTLDFVGRSIRGLPEGLRVRGLTPSSVQVELEPVERAERPVRVVTAGRLDDGYKLLAIDVQPERVTVEGPASAVERLESVPTEPIPLAGLTRTTEREVGLAVEERGVRVVDVPRVRVRLQVAAMLRERLFGGVPVVPRRPGWRVVPDVAQVTLLGPQAELEAIAPDEVTAMVQIPEGLSREPHVVRLGGPAPRLEVLHPGGREVRVGSVEPARFTLEPLP